MNDVSLVDDLSRLGLNQRQVEERTDNELGQEDFMTLMIAQFRNQDPFEPMDNGEFLGQLAQFGAVDGIDRLNQSFAGLSDSIYSDQALQASTLVGRDVLAATNTAYLPPGGELRGAINLGSSAQNIEIDIMDASGQLLRRLDLGQQPPGLAEFGWTGVTDQLDQAAPGVYRIEARVRRGTTVETTETLINARVNSVNLGGVNGMNLNVDGGETLNMNQIRRIQ